MMKYRKQQFDSAVKHVAENNPYARDKDDPYQWALDGLLYLLGVAKKYPESDTFGTAGFWLIVHPEGIVEILVQPDYSDDDELIDVA